MEKHPIDTALSIAAKIHSGQMDKDGNPAILHSLAVGMMGHTDEERATGFLHHVLDNGQTTTQALLEAGVHTGIVNALQVLSGPEQADLLTQAKHVVETGNPIALQVLYNDLKHLYSKNEKDTTLTQALETVKAAIEECSQITLYKKDGDYATAIFAGGCFWGVQQQKQHGSCDTAK